MKINGPVLAEILAQKGERRLACQKLSMAEKIMRMEALRERLAPLKASRGKRLPSVKSDVLNAG